MADSYEILGLDRDADEDSIRGRYLELVRRHSPERDPERFAEIRAAYEHLRDPIVSLENRLFCLDASHSLEEIVADARPTLRDRRLSTKVLLSLALP